MQEHNIVIPGISLCQKWGKIRIFHSTIVALGEPKYIRFLFNPEKRGLVVQACAKKEAECFRVPKYNPENSIAATIGIYNVQNDDEKNESTFRYIFFISYWVFGVCTICLIELLNSFISIWIGDTYLLNFSTVVIISIVFYITGINQIPSQYRTSFGIFKQAKMIPLLASVINIILSIVLGKIIGLNGIFIATIIAKLVTFNIMDPLLIYKNGFKKESISFFYSKIKYFIVLVITFLGVHLINDFLHVEGILGFVVRGAITFCITNLLLAILLYRDNEFKQLLRRGVKNGKS